MIIVAAWKSNKSGLGHYTRAKKYFEFLKSKNKKVKFIIFRDLNILLKKIKKKKANIILIDTYIFSKKIEIFLKKNFNKIIIINDYQFKIPKDFYLIDTFKFYKKINHKKIFLGQEYSVPNNKFSIKKIKKSINVLVILNKQYQNFFYKIYNQIDFFSQNKIKKLYFINVSQDKIRKKLKTKKNYVIKSFIPQNQLIDYAKKSQYIISPGGQTMMNLIENNQFINVYQTSSNQNFYIRKLFVNNFINKINFRKFKILKNKNNNYNKFHKNKKKLLEIFTYNE